MLTLYITLKLQIVKRKTMNAISISVSVQRPGAKITETSLPLQSEMLNSSIYLIDVVCVRRARCSVRVKVALRTVVLEVVPPLNPLPSILDPHVSEESQRKTHSVLVRRIYTNPL